MRCSIPGVVGFDRAMANFDRLRGRRDLPVSRDDDPAAGLALSWPGQQPVEGACMSESDQVAEETVAEESPSRPRSASSPSGCPIPRPTSTWPTTPTIAAAEEELLEEAIPVPAGPAPGRQAKVYLCERGHRTVAVWSEPTACHARPTRRAECGRPLYPIGELPEQVQKALNPLKASKKASKG